MSSINRLDEWRRWSAHAFYNRHDPQVLQMLRIESVRGQQYCPATIAAVVGCGILAAMDAELPDPDGEFYRRYLETCRRLGVEPVPREQVRPLVGEWNRLVHGESDATTRQ